MREGICVGGAGTVEMEQNEGEVRYRSSEERRAAKSAGGLSVSLTKPTMMSTGSGDGLQNGGKVRERDGTLKIRSKLVIIECESEEREKVSNSVGVSRQTERCFRGGSSVK